MDITEWMRKGAEKEDEAADDEAEIAIDEGMVSGALALAARGWPVFPCKHDKAPYVPGGFKSATTDQACIRAWWKQWTGAWVGVATGAVSGLVVLDVDNKPEKGKDGDAALAALEAKHGQLPDTPMVMTPSGGYHHYYVRPGGGADGEPAAWIKSTVDVLGVGLDTRCDGGYVIAPPSGGYEWEGSSPADMAECPQWIIDAIAGDGGRAGAGRAGAGRAGAARGDGGLNLVDRIGRLEPVPIGEEELPKIAAALAVLAGVKSVIDSYFPWIIVGMAIHEESGGSQQGFDLWDEWSQRSADNYPGEDSSQSTRRKWASFGKRYDNTVGIGTLFQMAREHGYVDAVAVEQREARTKQEAVWTAAQVMGAGAGDSDAGSGAESLPVGPERWRAGELPCEGLEGVRRLLMKQGCCSNAAAAGALTLGALLIARRWRADGCEALNLFHGVCSSDGRAGRKVLDIIEQLIRMAEMDGLIHQARIDSTQSARRALYETPSMLYSADDYAGLNEGGSSAIAKKARDGFAELIRFGWDGRTIMLRPGEMANMGKYWNKEEDIKNGAIVTAPAVVLLSSIGERQLPYIYSKEALDQSHSGRLIMVKARDGYHGKRIADGDDSEELRAVLESMRELGSGLLDNGPGYTGNVRDVIRYGGHYGEDDIQAIAEGAGALGSDWADAIQNDAVDAVARVTGVLGAWNGGDAGEDIGEWATRWVGHWYGAALQTIQAVGGAAAGVLSTSEQAYQCVLRHANKGQWLTEKRLIHECRALRAMDSPDNQNAIIQGLIDSGRVERRKPKGGGTAKRLYIVDTIG